MPEERLEARLGLTKYNKPAPLDDTVIPVRKVTVRMSQHIGAPAVPCVAEGDFVRCGQVIGAAAEGLSVPVHASIDGRVLKITGQAVEIQAQ